MIIYIYRIDFEDGAAYVGQTRRGNDKHSPEVTLNKRISNHKSQPANWELTCRLKKDKYTASIISKHYNQDSADKREIAEIRRLVKPINKYWKGNKERACKYLPPKYDDMSEKYENGKIKKFGAKKKKYKRDRIYERNETATPRCRVCFVVKPASDYHADRRRSNGLHSTCRQCKAYIRESCRRAKLAYLRTYLPEDYKLEMGNIGSKAYYKAIEEIRDGLASKRTTDKRERGINTATAPDDVT